MRGKAIERALVGGKLLPSDIDDRIRKACPFSPFSLL